MRDRWVGTGVMGAAAAAAAALFLSRSKPRAVPTQPAQVPQVSAPAPAPESLEITVSGQVQAAKTVNVTATVDGTIQELMADVGDVVIEGKLLARLKNPKLAIAEETAQSETERARNRINELEAALIAGRLEVSRSSAAQPRPTLDH